MGVDFHKSRMHASLLVVLFAALASADILYEDNFDTLDKSKWYLEVVKYPHNNELEYYTDRTENIDVQDGHLVITPLRENYGGKQYTSGRMHSLFHWKYGRAEVRAKLPNGYGLWPAIWMMPQYSVYGGWPQSGEIDICEARGQNLNQIASTIHYGTPSNHYWITSGDLTTGCSIDQYHVYTVDWTPTQLVYRLDGKAYYVQDLTNIANKCMLITSVSIPLKIFQPISVLQNQLQVLLMYAVQSVGLVLPITHMLMYHLPVRSN